jgi:hypothetical protein
MDTPVAGPGRSNVDVLYLLVGGHPSRETTLPDAKHGPGITNGVIPLLH